MASFIYKPIPHSIHDPAKFDPGAPMSTKVEVVPMPVKKSSHSAALQPLKNKPATYGVSEIKQAQEKIKNFYDSYQGHYFGKILMDDWPVGLGKTMVGQAVDIKAYASAFAGIAEYNKAAHAAMLTHTASSAKHQKKTRPVQLQLFPPEE